MDSLADLQDDAPVGERVERDHAKVLHERGVVLGEHHTLGEILLAIADAHERLGHHSEASMARARARTVAHPRGRTP